MNATQLLADVKRKAQITADNASLSDLDILDIATKELQTVIVPKVLSVRERYFARYTDLTLSTSRTYRIPSESIGNKLLQVEYIDSSGSQRDLNFVSPINNPRIEGYHIRNSSLILTQYAPSSGTLRMHYAMRPGALTESSVVTSGPYAVIGDTGFEIDAIAHGLSIGDKFSTQKPDSPYEYSAVDLVVLSAPISAVNHTGGAWVSADNLRVASVQDFASGDYLTKTQITTIPLDTRKSFFPQIPEEMHDWLSLRTTVRILESLGHAELMSLHKGKLEDMEKNILALITPRVDGSPKVIGCGELLGWSD